MKSADLTRILAGAVFLAGISAGAVPQQPGTEDAKPKPQTEDKKPFQTKPGKDRWLVKTASDPDAVKVNKRTQDTTVEKLLALARPKDLPLDGSNAAFQEKRAKPVETTIYSVEVDVVECRAMPDGDYRVTLRGASGKTLILEMPDPAFVKPDSPFFYGIKSAREQFEQKFKPEPTAKPVQAHARITGLGYWARAYGKTKPEGNLVQLHPVVLVDWMDEPSKAFKQAADKAQKQKDTTPKTSQ